MSYGEKHKYHTAIGSYDHDYDNYDAIREAKSKYLRNPEKYEAERSRSYNGYNSRGDKYERKRGYERVTVVLEHWSGCVGQGVADDIRMAIEDNFPDVKVTEFTGRIDSFEVFINGRLLYSRIMQGGYPYEEEVLDAVYRARQGKEIFQVDRYGGSGTCNIL